MLKKSSTSGTGFKAGSKCLKIRAHHLCCIQGFQGYGYSPIFVTNLKAVISEIKAFPSRLLKLVSECDVICASCPSKRECTAKDSIISGRIRSMDLVVMEKLKIKEGTIMEAYKAFSLVNSQLANASDITEVCGTCKWRQKCIWCTCRKKAKIMKEKL
ncbi:MULTISPECIES: DUF1284 domain-containing protein [Methanosarcina]|uniref:Iron-sulfur binding protein n=3 Tax=Methanosarcina barkeri TaxID=2208 RepID=A0A0E3QWU5_METBA|nr:MULTISPECIES: DUF1284 domain-containing protein [Methanosarcina]AKB56197.1 Iron-sulfur binding protein [Methanosarcina barkeri MS]AKB59675.1 Iron-sulfur binding protein [Methanosarcina barkeri 227]AKJ40338.1 hypothetical protein MCM1_3351 [Methanosarcina barkeri CM1]OED02764.1 (Fe-S)-binding protein [Methanosarcina sp. A14]